MMDFRSDTVTVPTEEMRQAMANAPVGDDVYEEDPTVRELEEKAAELLGKERALFVPTGTMANQIAVLVHTNPGDEVIVEQDAHIYYYELGALARLGGVQARTIKGIRGKMSLDQIREVIRPNDLHFPVTKLICIENTHNRAGGAVLSADETIAICNLAKEHSLAVHLDGARIFNAAIALDVSVKDLVAPVDSVMFCLSKGLAAPIGSILLGTEDFIKKARKWRKMLGGGMRQVGVIAACGLVGLNTMVDRMKDDHRMSKELATGLSKIPGISIDVEDVETNIVVIDVRKTGMTSAEFINKLRDRGIKATSFGPHQVRFVCHKDIEEHKIRQAIELVSQMLGEINGSF